jgi:hypothetical protein
MSSRIRMLLIRRKVWLNETDLTPPLLIEVTGNGTVMYICVSNINVASGFTIFSTF